jgi:hypothetical protein
MPTEVSLASITSAINAAKGIDESDIEAAEKDLGISTVNVPEEESKTTKYRGKNKSKVDQIEAKAWEHILEMFDAAEALKADKGKTLAEMVKKDPFMATQMMKELNLMVKRILDISITKLKIEELKVAKNKEGENNNGSKTIFIMQGRDMPVQINNGEVGIKIDPKQFEMKGRDF